MSRATKPEQPTKVADDITVVIEGERQKRVINSAFDIIFDLYQDEQTLEKTLTTARGKVSELEKKLKLSELRTSQLDDTVKRAKKALTDLDMKIRQDTKMLLSELEDADGEVRDPHFLPDIKSVITAFTERTQAYVHHQNESKRTKTEIEKAKRHVKMLEGAKVVADAGGMKRPREDESSENTSDLSHQVKPTQRSLSFQDKVASYKALGRPEPVLPPIIYQPSPSMLREIDRLLN